MARFLHIHPLQWLPILQPLLQKEAAPQIPPPTINHHHLLLLPLIWTAFSPNSVVRFQKQKQLEIDHEAPPTREIGIKEGGNRRCCPCVPTCCRSDDNKTCDHSLHSSDDRRLAEHKHIQAGPHQQTGCCAYVCVDDCNGGIYVGRKWVTTIEACPSQPQKTCTCKHEQHIVGRKTLTILCQSWSHLQNPTHSNFMRAYSADFTAQKLTSMKLPMEELLLLLLQWY